MTFDILGIRLTCSNLFYVRVMKEEAASCDGYRYSRLVTHSLHGFLQHLLFIPVQDPGQFQGQLFLAACIIDFAHPTMRKKPGFTLKLICRRTSELSSCVGSRSPRISSLIHKCLIIRHASIV